LGDVYGVAARQNRNRTERLMRDLLTVSYRTLPEWYRIWFAAPWSRIYTVNIDDLEAAANRAFDLPRDIEAVSGFDESVLPSERNLQVCI